MSPLDFPMEILTDKPMKKRLMHKVPTYRLCLISALLGILISGIPLSAFLALYLKQETCTTISTSSTTTTTSTTSTTTTSTTSTTTTTSTSTTTTTTSIYIANATLPYYCSGVSPASLWLLYSTSGIYMDIDTSSCYFNTTALYFTSLGGATNHWMMSGISCIYSSTATSFRVYSRPLDGTANTVVLSYAQTYQWDLHWFGIVP